MDDEESNDSDEITNQYDSDEVSNINYHGPRLEHNV